MPDVAPKTPDASHDETREKMGADRVPVSGDGSISAPLGDITPMCYEFHSGSIDAVKDERFHTVLYSVHTSFHGRGLSIPMSFYRDPAIVTIRAILEQDGQNAGDKFPQICEERLEPDVIAVFALVAFHYGALQVRVPGDGEIEQQGFDELLEFISLDDKEEEQWEDLFWRSIRPKTTKIKDSEELKSTFREGQKAVLELARNHVDYLYVGGGIFGASAACHRIQSNSTASVAIVNQSSYPSLESAGCDYKIVSSAQTDPFYTELALKALEAWRSQEPYKQHFKQTGQVFMGAKEPAEKVCENYKRILGQSPTELVNPKDARERYPVLKDANWDDHVEMCTWNKDAGWADGGAVLKAVCEAACERGAKYRVATVEKLLKNDDDVCYGARILENGKTHTIIADNIVLCTGAYTSKLLAESFPDREVQPGKRLKAAGVSMAYYNLDPDAIVDFEKAPVVVKSVGKTPSEFIPPRDDGLFKIVAEQSYTNMQQVGQFRLSVPPEKASLRWNINGDGIPQQLRDNADDAKWELLGKRKVTRFSYETCWDATTPNQDFMICEHPVVKRLHMATGGSFHGFKYMPIVGQLINQSVDGELDDTLAERWAWDGKGSDGACAIYDPAGADLQLIMGSGS
ncbi:sarcosine oxidase [Blastomyces dermatitidis ER-3]|uniref:Sarcosine oxidase n=2 Tax=Ajellomyces dermatitidis TaxID=5039 RepID=F2TT58_AJEDA|nr:sarcosine oxidase [Blastomyces dermatitidis ER-3]EGE86421.2 sarcosine oxidase [Blastomyces dermatitidis ATCC 18188]OAS99545.1 sarcosine oxidase [Blastomyces dermatitidis ER-3]